jgi:citrate lyase beta subunit
LSTQVPASSSSSLSRSYLYVPSSSDRMLEKSINAGSDVIIYDLEDSVSPAPEDKLAARARLRKFLEVNSMTCNSQTIAATHIIPLC